MSCSTVKDCDCVWPNGGSGGIENLEFEFDLTNGPILNGLIEYVAVGDMDGNGHVDALDAPLIRQALVNRPAYDAVGYATPAGFLVDADAYGDVNGDGVFNGDDLSAFNGLLSRDLDGDGNDDGRDFLLIQRGAASVIPQWEAEFGRGIGTVAAAEAVPEPASVWLLIAALNGRLLSRRR
jgi:hypothetical protein